MAARTILGGVQDATGRAGGLHEGVRQVTDALRSNSQELWDGLFATHKDAVYKYLCANMHMSCDAEDVMQETFLKAVLLRYRLKQGGRDIYHPEGMSDQEWRQWLIGIARNLSMQANTRSGRRGANEKPMDSGLLATTRDFNLTPDELAVLNDRQQHLYRLVKGLCRLAALTDAEQQVLAMRFAGELSHEGIAAALSLSGGKPKTGKAVRKMYSRAMDKIKKGIDGAQEKYDVDL